MAAFSKLSRDYDAIIEPSAGNGAFLDQIKHKNKIGIDIAPARSDIIRCDWLKYTIPQKFQKVLILGNPPFGLYHKTSQAFILHALSQPKVQTIAFILPNGYRKHTRQRIIPHNWRIIDILPLPSSSFTLDGKDYSVPCSFFIFDKSRGRDLRVNTKLYAKSTDFEFGDKNNFDVFVFGASPRKIIKNPTLNNRGYFLKSNISANELIKKIREVDWQGHSSASGGVYWLTKYEFLEQYVKHHEC